MSCSCNASRPIVAALDTLFESEPDGSPTRHWLPQDTWTRFCGARNVQHFVSVLGVSGDSPVVSFVAQASIDGKSWADVADLCPGNIAAPTTNSTTLCALDDATQFALLVRFGVQMAGSTSLAGVRLTWLLVPDFATNQPLLEASSGTVASPSAGATVLGPIEVLAAGHITIAATAAASGTVKLQTSRDGSQWYDVQGASLVLSGSNSMSLGVEGVLRLIQLVAEGPIAGDVHAEIVARGQ